MYPQFFHSYFIYFINSIDKTRCHTKFSGVVSLSNCILTFEGYLMSNHPRRRFIPLPRVLVWFYGITTIVGYLMLNPFLSIFFKQFSLAEVHSLNVKNSSIVI